MRRTTKPLLESLGELMRIADNRVENYRAGPPTLATMQDVSDLWVAVRVIAGAISVVKTEVDDLNRQRS